VAIELKFGAEPEVSAPVTLVDDDALVDFSGTPANSEIAYTGRCGLFSIYVDASPEAGHAIHMTIQSTCLADSATFFDQCDQDPDDPDAIVWKFDADKQVELGPFYGANSAIRAKYGFFGGTGAGATLKVYLQGRAS